MKITTQEYEEPAAVRPTPPNWVQLRPLILEMLLLIMLFFVLGVLRLDYSAKTIWLASWQHVPPLVMWLAIFGAYRTTNANNAVKLFSSHFLSMTTAGAVFLLSAPWLVPPAVGYRFDIFFLGVAFFMLNTIRPLLHCRGR